MAAPVVVSVSPGADATDVVLGQKISVEFDQPVDQASVNTASFALMGPGQVGLVGPNQLYQNSPTISTGREWVKGVFLFPPGANRVDFIPETPLRPNTTYTVLVAGGNSSLALDVVKNIDGEKLEQSFQWSFSTGILPGTSIPPSSPLPATAIEQSWQKPKIKPEDIAVTPRAVVGNNLSTIELNFPGEIDPTSFSLNDVLVGIEPILNDPLVMVPQGLTKTVTVSGSKIIIQIGNLP